MIKVIDGVMSIGKSHYMINKIKNDDSDTKYIYITPYLDEITRVKEECRNKHFISPDENKMGTKTRHFKHLINKGCNICATHSLFRGADSELLELLNAQNYVLVLDEVLDVVEPIQASKKDLSEILDRYAHVDSETMQLIWDDLDYKGNHINIMQMAMSGSLTVVNNVVLLWNFPVEIFKSFKEVYILTYLFDAQIQRYYFDYYGVKYKKYSLDRKLTESKLVDYGKSEYENNKIKQLKELITIYEGGLNSIGDGKTSLSKSWFSKNKDGILNDRLKKNIFSYFQNNVKTKSRFNGWTTFKDYKKEISGKGYTRGFIPVNMRASNNYSHKQSMAYIANRFMNPFVKKMFSYREVKLNEDLWGLSEMIQWIFRGCVRKNEPMNVYIPSKRMRELFVRWLDGEFLDIEKSLLEVVCETFDLDLE